MSDRHQNGAADTRPLAEGADVLTANLRPPIHVIDPRAVYDLLSATAALGLARTCLAREVRKRRLRVSRRGGRYFILGAWLLEWLRAGEVNRRTPPRAGNGEGE
jgi:hypothetical protein